MHLSALINNNLKMNPSIHSLCSLSFWVEPLHHKANTKTKNIHTHFNTYLQCSQSSQLTRYPVFGLSEETWRKFTQGLEEHSNTTQKALVDLQVWSRTFLLWGYPLHHCAMLRIDPIIKKNCNRGIYCKYYAIHHFLDYFGKHMYVHREVLLY